MTGQVGQAPLRTPSPGPSRAGTRPAKSCARAAGSPAPGSAPAEPWSLAVGSARGLLMARPQWASQDGVCVPRKLADHRGRSAFTREPVGRGDPLCAGVRWPGRGAMPSEWNGSSSPLLPSFLWSRGCLQLHRQVLRISQICLVHGWLLLGLSKTRSEPRDTVFCHLAQGHSQVIFRNLLPRNLIRLHVSIDYFSGK